MKLAVLRSVPVAPNVPTGSGYLQAFDTRFAERVLGNLRGRKGFCTACGPDCNACRAPYGRTFGADIAAVLDFPALMPHVLERPWDHVPSNVPHADVLLVINIHEQILLEILPVCGRWGVRAVVAPLEAPGWVSRAARAQAYRVCEETGVEIAFPKPFCAFKPPAGTVLAAFREAFHIGCPDVTLDVGDGEIRAARVNVSAACGATYCVARWLAGRRVEENLEIEVVSRRWHAYPCTASMERDPELNGETPLHVAGQAHYAILLQARDRVAGLEDPMVRSPLGTMVQRPVPPREHLANIEKAKAVVLEELARDPDVTLARLRARRDISPAALTSALVLLKQEGHGVTPRGDRGRAG